MLVADCNISSVIALFGLPTEQPGTEGHTLVLNFSSDESNHVFDLQGMAAKYWCIWGECRLGSFMRPIDPASIKIWFFSKILVKA